MGAIKDSMKIIEMSEQEVDALKGSVAKTAEMLKSPFF